LRSFCRAAKHPSYGPGKRRTVSPTTLSALEDGQIPFPSATTMDAIENAFAAFGVPVDVTSLERAWMEAAPAAAPAWLREHTEAANRDVAKVRAPASVVATATALVARAAVGQLAADGRVERAKKAPTRLGAPVVAAVGGKVVATRRARRKKRRAIRHREQARGRLQRYVDAHERRLDPGASTAR
jgi:transcriptional regulator with XRE-family HTH domain